MALEKWREKLYSRFRGGEQAEASPHERLPESKVHMALDCTTRGGNLYDFDTVESDSATNA